VQGIGVVWTYNMAIIACGRACRAAEALDVFDRMLSAGLAPCLTTYTALMSLFCRVGALSDACIVFESMKAAGVAPNTITYSSLINGCEKAVNLDAAVLYFEEMLVRGNPLSLQDRWRLFATLCSPVSACVFCCRLRRHSA
jgi:pentatricopeptide repeat protein